MSVVAYFKTNKFTKKSIKMHRNQELCKLNAHIFDSEKVNIHVVHLQVNAPGVFCLPYRFKWVKECLHSSQYSERLKKIVYDFSF